MASISKIPIFQKGTESFREKVFMISNISKFCHGSPFAKLDQIIQLGRMDCIIQHWVHDIRKLYRRIFDMIK